MGNIGASNKKFLKQARSKRKSQECMLKQYILEQTKTNDQEVFSLDLMDLERKQISCEEIPFLFHCIPKKESLVHLRINLQHNNIREEGAKHLADNLSSCEKLKSFHIQLDNNCIGDKGLSYLINVLNQLKSLESVSLYLQNNSISQDGIDAFESIRENTSMRDFTISLSRNTIGRSSEKIINQIAMCFPNIKELQVFLQSCELTNAGIQIFSQKLSKLKKLQKLSLFLNDNSITDNGILALNNAISLLSDLQFLTLNICDNKFNEEKSYFSPINVFSDKCTLKILQSLSSLQNLKQLNFTMKNYNHTDYMNFLKNGFEALEREQQFQNKGEIDSIIKDYFGNEQQFLIEV